MTIQVGSTIEIEVNGSRQTWKIVGSGEGDLEHGKVSFSAPLIEMVMGGHAGDQVTGKILGREVIIKILKVD